MTDGKTEQLQDGERLDNIGFGGFRLIQKPDEFCYGVDAVLLADFAARGGGRFKTDESGHVVNGYNGSVTAADLGTGTGIIPLILNHKIPALTRIAGLEVQEASAERAVRNMKLNGVADKINIICGDVSDADAIDRLGAVAGGAFDIVTMNPPYFEDGKGPTGGNEAKMIARTESSGTLEHFIQAAAKLLKDRGDLYIVHRPSRLADICCLCRQYKIEPKAMRFVSPKIGEEPNILLVHGVRCGGRELRIRKSLAVYNEDGSYTQEINMIYER